MMLQIPDVTHVSEFTKFLFVILTILITNFITYIFGKRKYIGESKKFEGEAHKSEADALSTQVNTIKQLSDELGDMIDDAKSLRSEIRYLEKAKQDLEIAVEDAKKACRIQRYKVLEVMESAIETMKNVVNNLSKDSPVTQELRMKAVLVLEHMFRARQELEENERLLKDFENSNEIEI